MKGLPKEFFVGDIPTFVNYLKSNNTHTNNVKIQGKNLTEKEIQENFEHIRNYSESEIYKGYYCSTSDPFIILICELFKVNVEHQYCSVIINYTVDDPKMLLKISSCRSHLNFVGMLKY
jgi:hypothetical protein